MATTTAATFASSTIMPPSAAIINQANPNRDGTGPMQALGISGSQLGTRVDWIRIQALAATTNGMIRLFMKPWNGAISMFAEIPVAAATPNSTTPAFSADYFPPYNPMLGQSQIAIPLYWQILASTENAEPFAITAFGSNL